ncbi:hypothetical protein [Paludisphaera sp.]|uniref:hypothetical protein n=1 Tax=Paludisphaera sp. TaxID=2017432 RepID=UPI00301DABF0
MGHSYLDFDGRTILLHDSLIEAIVKLMSNEFIVHRQDYDPRSIMTKQFREWLSNIEHSGVGCIDLQLDACLSDGRVLEQNLKLLDAVEKTVKNFGDMIPLSFLRTAVGPGYGRGIESRIVLRALSKFRALLLKGGESP